MKKIISLCSLLIMLMTTVASASYNSMPRTAMYIGGIGAGCTMGYVKSVYGEPAEKKVSSGQGLKTITYIYSDTFKVMTINSIRNTADEDELIVKGFVCTDETLKTPFGVSVGMPFSEVSDKFGPGRESKNDYGKYHVYHTDSVSTWFYVDDDEEETIYKIQQMVE